MCGGTWPAPADHYGGFSHHLVFVVAGFSYFILISGREELKAAVEHKINPKRNGSEEGLGNLTVITDLPSQNGDQHRAQEWD